MHTDAEMWRRAVEAAVDYLADDYEVDPDEVLAQESFIALLDPTVGLDPDADAEAFAERVEEALAEWTYGTTEAYSPENGPPANNPQGGQFAVGGGRVAAKGKPAAGRKSSGSKRQQPKKPAGPLGYDGKTGTGYGNPKGDPQVHELQRALNTLGFKDAQGQPLVDDGKFGPRTTAAVRAMQKALGLPTDGKVTPELLARVKQLAAKKGTQKPATPPKTRRKGTTARAQESEHVEVPRADRIEGRVLEAVGTDSAGGRVFRVRIIREGVSKNRKRYTESVLRTAAPLYNGAKCYDHHRTPAEMATSTLSGLVGGYRNVAYEVGADGGGLYGDLHLLPSAVHTAEALDASIAAQQAGLPPLVGISHDVLASFKASPAGPRGHVQEAVAITRVHSADVVADPSAGGQAERVLAGGIEPDTEESDVEVTTEAVLDAFSEASDEQLAAYGLTRVTTAHTTEAAGEPKSSFLASLMIKAKLHDAGLPESVREAVTAGLPERITESDVDTAVAAYKGVLAGLEKANLAPTVASTQVVRESREKVVEGLDKAFSGDYSHFRSIKQAFQAFTGQHHNRWGEDENRVILRESAGAFYDSGTRTTESMTSSTWAEVLGDSITRRMIQMYRVPALRNWRPIVSDIVPVNDFRTQRRTRVGGYGTLPVVAEGGPYQPLTSPGDEEATYALEKKGGTEDFTLEMIANDDLSALARIPRLLGLAAARTLHNFVWDFLLTNPTIYDSVTLFHASHANTTAVALSQSGMSSLRQKMRDQTGYGDTSNILSLVPRFLIVPNELEELAFQLCSSAVAIPSTPAGPSDTPNLHRSMEPIVVDYATDANDWFQVADPDLCPTIELGFYQGREEPELFTQSDQSVGSMFNADKFTYKIRHTYKGAVVEYRGMQRGTQ